MPDNVASIAASTAPMTLHRITEDAEHDLTLYQASTDAGRTWGSDYRLPGYVPAILAGGARVLIALHAKACDDTLGLIRNSHNGDPSSWSRVSCLAGSKVWDDVRIAAAGDSVYAAWSDDRRRVHVDVSHDAGVSFAHTVLGNGVFAPEPDVPNVAIAADGEVVVAAWRVSEEKTVLRISRDRGRTWTRASPLPTRYLAGVRNGRILAIDEGGASFVFGKGSWRQIRNPDGSMDMNVDLGPSGSVGSFSFGETGFAWRTSADDGAHWSNEVLPVSGPGPDDDIVDYPGLVSWLDDGTIVATYDGQLLVRP